MFIARIATGLTNRQQTRLSLMNKRILLPVAAVLFSGLRVLADEEESTGCKECSRPVIIAGESLAHVKAREQKVEGTATPELFFEKVAGNPFEGMIPNLGGRNLHRGL